MGNVASKDTLCARLLLVTTTVLHLLLIFPLLLLLLLLICPQLPLILRYIHLGLAELSKARVNVSHLSARCMLYVDIYYNGCKMAGSHVQEIFKGEEGEGLGKELSDQLPP